MVSRTGKEFIISYQNTCKDIMVTSITDTMITYLTIWRSDGLCCVAHVLTYLNTSNAPINEHC